MLGASRESRGPCSSSCWGQWRCPCSHSRQTRTDLPHFAQSNSRTPFSTTEPRTDAVCWTREQRRAMVHLGTRVDHRDDPGRLGAVTPSLHHLVGASVYRRRHPPYNKARSLGISPVGDSPEALATGDAVENGSLGDRWRQDGSGSRDSWDSESYCHERHSSLGTDAPCPSRWAVDIDHERDLVRSGKARARTRAPQTISRASRGARFCDCCSGRSTERVGCTCAAVVLRLRPRHHRYYPDPGRLAHGWGFDRSDCAATVSLGDGALGLCISAQGSAYVARRDGFVYVVASPEALA